TLRRIQVGGKEDEVCPSFVGSRGDEKSLQVGSVSEAADCLREGLASLGLLLAPGFGEDSSPRDPKHAPDTTVGEVEDALALCFERHEDARQGFGIREAVVAEVGEGLRNRRLDVQAGVNGTE